MTVILFVMASLILSNCTSVAPIQEHVAITKDSQRKSAAGPALVEAAVPSKVTKATAPLTSSSSISLTATLRALPPGPSVARSRVVVEAFINAYNYHDSSGLLILLDDAFQYADCDYANHIFQIFRTKPPLEQWLHARFAEHAHVDVQEIIIANPQGTPPSDLWVIGVGVIRTGDTYKRPIQDGFKLILNKAGDRFATLALSSRNECHR